MRNFISLSIPLIALCASFAACDDDHAAEPSVGEDACEHFSNGPTRAVTAGDSASAAVDASEEHTRYDLTLAGAAAPHAGFVKVAIGEAGDYGFFFDGPVDVAITDAAGNAVAAESSATSDPDCATVKVALIFELDVGTYTVVVSAGAPDVSLVWFPAGDHGH